MVVLSSGRFIAAVQGMRERADELRRFARASPCRARRPLRFGAFAETCVNSSCDGELRRIARRNACLDGWIGLSFEPRSLRVSNIGIYLRYQQFPHM